MCCQWNANLTQALILLIVGNLSDQMNSKQPTPWSAWLHTQDHCVSILRLVFFYDVGQVKELAIWAEDHCIQSPTQGHPCLLLLSGRIYWKCLWDIVVPKNQLFTPETIGLHVFGEVIEHHRGIQKVLRKGLGVPKLTISCSSILWYVNWIGTTCHNPPLCDGIHWIDGDVGIGLRPNDGWLWNSGQTWKIFLPASLAISQLTQWAYGIIIHASLLEQKKAIGSVIKCCMNSSPS